jgi:hypothetical protein
MKTHAAIGEQYERDWHAGGGGFALPHRMARLVQDAIKARDDEWLANVSFLLDGAGFDPNIVGSIKTLLALGLR